MLSSIANCNDTKSIDILLESFEGFSTQSTYLTGSSPSSVAVGDFNNDTQLDMVVTNSGNHDVSVLLGYGNGSFADQTTYDTGVGPWSIAFGDFNNDTILDIVVANYGSNNLDIFLGHGDGTFAERTPVPLDYGSRPFMVLVGDFNNDRKLDFAVANYGTDSLQILLQTC